MVRLITMIVWGVLVLIGTYLLASTPHGVMPTKSAPMNTYLLGNDVISGLDGRYVVAPNGLDPKAEVRASDTGEQPRLLEGSQGKLTLLVKVTRAEILSGVNAGSTRLLCAKTPPAYGAVTVQAVRCDQDRAKDQCIAMIEIPTAIAQDVVSKGLKDQNSINELHIDKNC